MSRKSFKSINLKSEEISNKKLSHEDFVAGIPPYLRGPYSTMYISRPWTRLIEDI